MLEVLFLLASFALTLSAEDTHVDQDNIVVTQFDFASAKAGAKIIGQSEGTIEGAANLLEESRDKYMIVPCSGGPKWVVIQLAEDITVYHVNVSNYESFSESFDRIELFGSSVYPTNAFHSLGVYNIPHHELDDSKVFSFVVQLGRTIHVRYLKFSLIPPEVNKYHFCTLTSINVYGVRSLEKLEREINKLGASSVGQLLETDSSENNYSRNVSNDGKNLMGFELEDEELSKLLEELLPSETMFEEFEKVQVSQPQSQHVFEKLASRISILELHHKNYGKNLRNRMKLTLTLTHKWISQLESLIKVHSDRLDSLLLKTLEKTQDLAEKSHGLKDDLDRDIRNLESRCEMLEWMLITIIALLLLVVLIIMIYFCIFTRIRSTYVIGSLQGRSMMTPLKSTKSAPNSQPTSPEPTYLSSPPKKLKLPLFSLSSPSDLTLEESKGTYEGTHRRVSSESVLQPSSTKSVKGKQVSKGQKPRSKR